MSNRLPVLYNAHKNRSADPSLRAEIRLAKTTADTTLRAQKLDMIRGAGTGIKEILLKILDSPINLLIGAAAVEYAQTIEIPVRKRIEIKRDWDWTRGWVITYGYETQYEPLISQTLATAIEGAMLAPAAVGALGKLTEIGTSSAKSLLPLLAMLAK